MIAISILLAIGAIAAMGFGAVNLVRYTIADKELRDLRQRVGMLASLGASVAATLFAILLLTAINVTADRIANLECRLNYLNQYLSQEYAQPEEYVQEEEMVEEAPSEPEAEAASEN